LSLSVWLILQFVCDYISNNTIKIKKLNLKVSSQINALSFVKSSYRKLSLARWQWSVCLHLGRSRLVLILGILFSNIHVSVLIKWSWWVIIFFYFPFKWIVRKLVNRVSKQQKIKIGKKSPGDSFLMSNCLKLLRLFKCMSRGSAEWSGHIVERKVIFLHLVCWIVLSYSDKIL